MSKILQGLPEEKLTPTEEEYLARWALQTPGEPEPIHKLTLHNLREALPYATRCCRGALREDEIFSVCYAALMKAAKNFRPGGIRFFAYSKVYVRGELSRTWKTKDVVRSSSLHETEVEPELPRLGLRTLTDSAEDEKEKSDGRVDVIEPNFVEPAFASIDLKERWSLVAPLIGSALNERERTVVQLYYESGFSFEEIGDLLVPSVSRAAVQSTHCRALKKLRGALIRSKKLEV